MNAHRLRIDASVIVSLVAAAVGFAAAAAVAFIATPVDPTFWIISGVFALAGIIWIVTAYINAQTAWLRVDTARIRADTARIYAQIADRQRNA